MTTISARNWWLLALRGALAVLFAVMTYFWPLATVAALVLLFGAYSLVDGVFALATAFERLGRHERWGAMLVQGLLGIGAGLVALFWPGLTALTLLIVIGVWAIVTGVTEIVAAIQLREVIQNEWLLALGGLLSVLFGVMVLVFPGAGALSVVWLIASYAFVYGIVLIILGFRLRSWQQHVQQGSNRNVAHQM